MSNALRSIMVVVAALAGLTFLGVGALGETAIDRTAGGALAGAFFLFIIVLFLEWRLSHIAASLDYQNELLEQLVKRRSRPKQRED